MLSASKIEGILRAFPDADADFIAVRLHEATRVAKEEKARFDVMFEHLEIAKDEVAQQASILRASQERCTHDFDNGGYCRICRRAVH
jgi:hypothetical protein